MVNISELIGILFALAASILSAPGPIFLKKASADFKLKLSFLLNKYLIAGCSIYGFGLILSTIALHLGDLSVIGPIFSSIYLWVTIISIKYLKEKPSIPQLTGVVLIIIGISLIVI